MGDLSVQSIQSEETRQRFMQLLIREVEAMDLMIRERAFEKDIQRIGAEQEMCLIDEDYLPSFSGPEILESINDPHYTTEIGRFNMEVNLDPFTLRSDCLRLTERQLLEMLGKGSAAASEFDARILLTGILPTLTQYHLTRDSMTPRLRYELLSKVLRELRDSHFEIRIQGADELTAALDSVMFEACNTSFQMHLQIAPEDFVEAYNWSLLISAPVLAAAVNSPLLFGRELWMETRIALFQQSLDTRRSSNLLHERKPRVFFGNFWLRDSVIELFIDHATRFPVLLVKEIEEDPMEALAQGRAPELSALRLHNGTIYTWNRPCYGLGGGQAHLRIENRYIPSGPTVADEMANFAFWIGLMKAQPKALTGFHRNLPFRVVKDNFYRAARNGLNTLLDWFGKEIPAADLLRETLLPIAYEGLERIGINQTDAGRYLGIIEERVNSRQTGAEWIVENFRRCEGTFGTGVAVTEITETMYHYHQEGKPVHTWPAVNCHRVYAANPVQDPVSKFMSTDLYSVTESEPMAFVKAIMVWKKIRHLPVESPDGKLKGLVTATNLRAFETHDHGWQHLPVRQMMVKELVTCSPETPLKSAANLMRTYGVGCLPVVENGNLLGLITDTDLKRLGLLN